MNPSQMHHHPGMELPEAQGSKSNGKPKMHQFEDVGDDSDDDIEKPVKRSGRRKIKIEYIEDKNRRHITFSKRKAGIMKKVCYGSLFSFVQERESGLKNLLRARA